MAKNQIRYLSRMGVDVWRIRPATQRATAPAPASGESSSHGRQQGTPHRYEEAMRQSGPDLAASNVSAPDGPGKSVLGDGDALSLAYVVRYPALTVVAEAGGQFIEDVVAAFPGERQRPLGQQQVTDAATLHAAVPETPDVCVVFGEKLGNWLGSSFVAHDIQLRGSCRYLMALAPTEYADAPLQKRYLWQALRPLKAEALT